MNTLNRICETAFRIASLLVSGISLGAAACAIYRDHQFYMAIALCSLSLLLIGSVIGRAVYTRGGGE